MLPNPATRLLITVGLIVFAFSVALHARTSVVEFQSDVTVLVPEKIVETGMTTGDNHTLKVRLNANEYLRVVIEQIGINVIITVLDPAGEKVMEVDAPVGAYGPEYVSFIAKKNGDYFLKLRTVT